MTTQDSDQNPGDEDAEQVRAMIEAGTADSKAGRTTPVEDVRVRFGLEP